MAEQLAFELVSPVKKLLGKAVSLVTMPGTEGDFGVLPGHAPLIATLRPGVIEVQEADKVTDRIFVAGGFAEVTATRCTVLAQEAVPVAELSRAKLEENLKQLDADYAAAETEAARQQLAAQRAVVQAKCAAAPLH